MKYYFLIIFLFFGVQNIFAQQKIIATISFDKKSLNKNEIVYQPNKPIRLSDFEGVYEKGSNAVAMAYTGVAVQYDGMSKNGTLLLNIKLLVTFKKDQSWCLEKARNEYTLAHEQRHFDITALNACALFKALKTHPFTKNFEKEIVELQNKFQHQNEAQQDLYDKETNHGINEIKQAEWHTFIETEFKKCTECYEQ